MLEIDVGGVDGAGLELAEETFEVAGIEARRAQDLVTGNGDGICHGIDLRKLDKAALGRPRVNEAEADVP